MRDRQSRNRLAGISSGSAAQLAADFAKRTVDGVGDASHGGNRAESDESADERVFDQVLT